MDRILKIAKREYLESVKSKTFIISVLFAPIFFGFVFFFTSRLSGASKEKLEPLRVAYTDLTGKLSEQITGAFDVYNKSATNRRIEIEQVNAAKNDIEKIVDQQKENLRKGLLDVYAIIDPNIIEGQGKVTLYTYKTKAYNVDAVLIVERLFDDTIRDYRYKTYNIDRALLDKIRNVASEQIEISSAGQEEKTTGPAEQVVSMMAPFFFMYLMFLGIFANGQQLLTSIIEEKSSRIIECLLSAASPFELMAGKIIGLCTVSITVVAIWSAMAYSGVAWAGLSINITITQILLFVIYYILGFILLGAVMAGIGSICNTLKDAQNMMMPITIIVIIPMISSQNLIQNPDGMYARLLSFFPPVTSMVMVLRISAAGKISPVEIAATLVLLVLSAIAVIWLAAKVFRTGVLMYGKKPTLREVAHWLGQR
jgi:ABC-2 type transport system permease protein